MQSLRIALTTLILLPVALVAGCDLICPSTSDLGYKVHDGWTRAEVVSLLGEPQQTLPVQEIEPDESCEEKYEKVLIYKRGDDLGFRFYLDSQDVVVCSVSTFHFVYR